MSDAPGREILKVKTMFQASIADVRAKAKVQAREAAKRRAVQIAMRRKVRTVIVDGGVR